MWKISFRSISSRVKISRPKQLRNGNEPFHEAIELVDDLIRVGGQVSIEQFNQTAKEKFDLSIESEESVTLAGYVLELFESKIPAEGEEVHDNYFHYKICQVDGNRIVTIEVIKIDN
jgi:CBS domain containing-hemolysin-like protein